MPGYILVLNADVEVPITGHCQAFRIPYSDSPGFNASGGCCKSAAAYPMLMPTHAGAHVCTCMLRSCVQAISLFMVAKCASAKCAYTLQAIMTQEDMALADNMLERLLALGSIELLPSQARTIPPTLSIPNVPLLHSMCLDKFRNYWMLF